MSERYRSRLAPTPSGYLHAGHARTFYHAWKMARERGGEVILRIEDIDSQRCRREYEESVLEDLRWLGLDWDEGPDVGGDYGPYRQSECRLRHEQAWSFLSETGCIYASTVTRREIEQTASRKEADGMTWLFPTDLRADPGATESRCGERIFPDAVNWRFRVPEGEEITFMDERCGLVRYRSGKDFGDFLIWRKDNSPAYELAVVVDDLAMSITDVVRGEDLLLSTARQILLYRALGSALPRFCHLPLVCDGAGRRLSKTDRSQSLRELRRKGKSPLDLQNTE